MGRPIHVVVSLVSNERKQYLQLRRPDDDKKFPGEWQFPGGKVEQGETLREAAERELYEETGLVSEARAVLSDSRIINDEYTFWPVLHGQYAYTPSIRISKEHAEARWIALPDIRPESGTTTLLVTLVERLVMPLDWTLNA